ncbi:DUF3784 domain-containing protein [Psychroflexus sp. CAK8W]|uniref:DUF3784 domain-containing protein n=1 Tax=Psychroflexus longus TaxID=2873596 RepID=A0ABS7XJD3_9FLAO|nr:DUF3784 domain-containing protein [Psychroflexus longus]MBZ9778599.1 DUF3784 domain-containing protein [Psychroflexus longus]
MLWFIGIVYKFRVPKLYLVKTQLMMIVPILFITLGILIKYKKMYSLIAGYNTMTEEEKQTYDVEGIATLMKNVMFGMAFIVITGLVVAYWTSNSDYEFYALGLALILGIPYLLIKSNSKTYKNR